MTNATVTQPVSQHARRAWPGETYRADLDDLEMAAACSLGLAVSDRTRQAIVRAHLRQVADLNSYHGVAICRPGRAR